MFLTYQLFSEKKNIIFNIFLLIIISVLFILLINENEIIEKIGVNIIYISTILTFHSIFYHSLNKDFSNGTIEQLLLQPISIELFFIKKIFCTSLFYQFNMIFVIPFLSTLINISIYSTLKLTLVTIFSIPIIITISLLGGTLSLKSKDIMSIITLPLLIPILIFGSSAIHSNTQEYTNLLLLLILVILTIPINIIAISYLLKAAIQNEG
ncbi:MAG: heme exporter protein CcmB [Rickettsiaceae bacterium H1]|nr:heme exporter protein CcmB [Rickettsiaceae bacterium H1]